MNSAILITNKLDSFKTKLIACFSGFTKSSADTLAWISIVALNLTFVPSIVAVMSGMTDRMPPLDIALIVWASLLLFFVRSAIIKDMLMVFTIGLGFAVQVVLLGMTFFA